MYSQQTSFGKVVFYSHSCYVNYVPNSLFLFLFLHRTILITVHYAYTYMHIFKYSQTCRKRSFLGSTSLPSRFFHFSLSSSNVCVFACFLPITIISLFCCRIYLKPKVKTILDIF